MKRVDLVKAFAIPDSYQPPADDELATNTEYPNLNSREYQKKAFRPGTGCARVFQECLAINEAGNAVLVCNRYTDRVWCGTFYGFNSVQQLMGDGPIEHRASFHMQCENTLSAVQYVEDDMLLCADSAGSVQLWSTRSPLRSSAPFALYKIGNRSEHIGAVSAMDVVRTGDQRNTTAITGGQDLCIKVWDMGAADLCSSNTYRGAHSREITGISCSPTDADLFVTCSRDKCVSVWDRRLTQPIVAFNESYCVGLTAVHWSGGIQDESEPSSPLKAEDKVFVGDEAGRIHCFDRRDPKRVYHSWQAFDDAPLHRMRFNGNRLVAVANSNEVKVFSALERYEELYANEQSKDYVRDAIWSDANTFYTIGWDSVVREHNL